MTRRKCLSEGDPKHLTAHTCAWLRVRMLLSRVVRLGGRGTHRGLGPWKTAPSPHPTREDHCWSPLLMALGLPAQVLPYTMSVEQVTFESAQGLARDTCYVFRKSVSLLFNRAALNTRLYNLAVNVKRNGTNYSRHTTS